MSDIDYRLAALASTVAELEQRLLTQEDLIRFLVQKIEAQEARMLLRASGDWNMEQDLRTRGL
jgi:hypothetical protein